MAVIATQAWAAVGDTFEEGYLKYKVLTEASGSNAYGTVTVEGLSATGKAKTSLQLDIAYTVTHNSKVYHTTRISQRAFFNNTTITTLRLRYGIEEIYDGAFGYCSKINLVHIPSSVNYIGVQAFDYCSALKTVNCATQDGNISMLDYTFPTKIPYLYVPNGADIDKIKKSKLGSFFTNICENFSVSDISFSTGEQLVVKNVTSAGLRECAIIGYKVGSTGGVFKPSMGRFTLTDYGCSFSITEVAKRAAYQNNDLKEVDFSNLYDLKEIGDSAFMNCQFLTKVNLGYSVQKLGLYSFRNTGITTIHIPASVTDLRLGSAFTKSYSLESITVDEWSSNFAAYDGVLYNQDYSTLLLCPINKTTVDIHKNVKRVDDNGFDECKISTIKFPYGIKELTYHSISDCPNLTEIFIPSSIEKIDEGLAYNCQSLKSLYLNAKKYIEYNRHCKTNQGLNIAIDLYAPRKSSFVDLWPGFMTKNPDGKCAYDFSTYSMSQGTRYYTVYSTEPITINGVAYDGEVEFVNWTGGTSTLNIPASITVDDKKYAVTRMGRVPFEEVTKDFAVTGCSNILYVSDFDNSNVTSIELPSVTKIGEHAFMDCTKLTSVSMPNVEHIYDWAFMGCTALTTCTWGHNLTQIYGYAFKNSGLTQDIILPYGFTYFLGNEIFAGIKSKSILIPSSTKRFDGDVFKGNTSFQEVIANINPNDIKDMRKQTLTGLPSNATIYVPVEHKSKFMTNSAWSDRTSAIKAGAYDFTSGSESSRKIANHAYTVTKAEPFTLDGEQYAGEVAVVMPPNVNSTHNYTLYGSAVDIYLGDSKKYLETAIGDSCLAGATAIETIDISRATSIKSIGNYALSGTNIAEITVPEACTSIGKDAFSNNAALDNLILLGDKEKTFTEPFVGNNADVTKITVKSNLLYDYYQAMAGWNVSANKTAQQRLAPYIIPEHDTQMFSACTQLNAPTGVKLNYVTSLDAATGIATTATRGYVFADYGYLLTGLTPGEMYKFTPNNTSNARMPNNMLCDVATKLYMNTVDNAYVWNAVDKVFEKPGYLAMLPSSSAYLLAADETAPKYYVDLFAPTPDFKIGDVNGDDAIDVTDINIIINIMLGNDNASNYNGRADVTGDGITDVSDLNAIVNIMLNN